MAKKRNFFERLANTLLKVNEEMGTITYMPQGNPEVDRLVEIMHEAEEIAGNLVDDEVEVNNYAAEDEEEFSDEDWG